MEILNMKILEILLLLLTGYTIIGSFYIIMLMIITYIISNIDLSISYSKSND